jgi:hypothetical protein
MTLRPSSAGQGQPVRAERPATTAVGAELCWLAGSHDTGARGGDVEIADAETHRLLAYVSAVNDQGVPLPARLAEEYGQRPTRRVFREGPMPAMQSVGLMLRTFSQAFAGTSRLEDAVAYLVRLGWAEREAADGQNVALTRLGRAVLRHLDQREVSSELALAITLKADDPLAYAQVIERIARHEDAMLVDGYLRVEVLPILLERTAVTRILTSRRGHDHGARIASLVAMLQRTDAMLQLRTGEVQDRYVIPPAGSIEMLGTSLSGVGKHVSAYIEVADPVATELRQLHERLWADAEVLHPRPEADNGDEAAES